MDMNQYKTYSIIAKNIRNSFYYRSFFLIIIFGIIILWASHIEIDQEKSAEVQADEQQELPVLMYHHLAPSYAPDWIFSDNEAVLTIEQFQNQMQLLYELDYKTLSLQELQNYLSADKKIPERSVVITFDDGYESNYHYAYPILKEYDHNSILFIIVSRIEEADRAEKKENFDYAELTYLSWAQIEKMHESGLMEIQNHSYDGHHMVEVNDSSEKRPALVTEKWLPEENRRETGTEYFDRLKDDFEKSQKIIADKIGEKPVAYAYPFGWKSETMLEALTSKGLEMGFGIESEMVQPGDNIWNINRINVSPGWKLQDFAEVLGENPAQIRDTIMRIEKSDSSQDEVY